MNAWLIYVESITGAWPFNLLNRLNPPLPPLHPCVGTGHHHPSPGSLLSLLMVSCLLPSYLLSSLQCSDILYMWIKYLNILPFIFG